MPIHNSKYFTGSQENETEIAKIMCLPNYQVLLHGETYWQDGPSCYGDLKNFVFALSRCLWKGFNKVVPSMNKDLDKIFNMICYRLKTISLVQKDPHGFLNFDELQPEVEEIIREQVFFKTQRKKRAYDSSLRIIHKFIYDQDPKCLTVKIKDAKVKYKQQAGNRNKAKKRKEKVFEQAEELFEKFKELPSLRKIQSWCSCGQDLATQARNFLVQKFMKNAVEHNQVQEIRDTVAAIGHKYKQASLDLSLRIRTTINTIIKNRNSLYLSPIALPVVLKPSPVRIPHVFVAINQPVCNSPVNQPNPSPVTVPEFPDVLGLAATGMAPADIQAHYLKEESERYKKYILDPSKPSMALREDWSCKPWNYPDPVACDCYVLNYYDHIDKYFKHVLIHFAQDYPMADTYEGLYAKHRTRIRKTWNG